MLRGEKSLVLKFNKEELRDKIYACWMGKNIGGTLGCPIEGIRSVCDIKGFTTEGALINDDLDLQLAWLRCVDQVGIENLNARTLGEYWLSYIGPWWNEYGTCKRNMKEGFLPPLSGQACNHEWRDSNGAWIRTEIWACLAPGCVEKATRFAYEDACVDHGVSEGTFAAMFVAAVEAAAFVVTDVKELIEIGLARVPKDSHIARAVMAAVDAYEKGLDWKEARENVMAVSKDLYQEGWMQAPNNVGFTVIGLLYGEGDFKKTLLTAINCGDDTDCTGATAGSVMGILYGTRGIPEDWAQFMGDKLEVGCIIQGHGSFPATCTELTEMVMRNIPSVVRAKCTNYIMGPLSAYVPDTKLDYPIMIHDGETDFGDFDIQRFKNDSIFFDKIYEVMKRTPYFVKMDNFVVEAYVAFDREPIMKPGETLTGAVYLALKEHFPEQKTFHLKWYCPNGWKVSGYKNIRTDTKDLIGWDDHSRGLLTVDEIFDGILVSSDFTIHASEEDVDAVNKIVLEIDTVGRPSPLFVPISILG